MSNLRDRVEARALVVDVGRALLTGLAAPLYLLGLLFGLVWMLVTVGFAAVATGFDDGRRARRAGDLPVEAP